MASPTASTPGGPTAGEPTPGGPTPDDLLLGLTEEQRRAVCSEAPQVCVMAGAGSGKTRVLTRRIAHRLATGRADEGHVLALTFTRKAAGELGERLAGLGGRQRVATGTFHAVAIAALRQHWADAGRRPPGLLERKARVLAPLAAARPALARVPLRELAGHLEWAQARLIGPDELEEALATARRRCPVPPAELAALYRRYTLEKQRRHVLDFDDVLAECARAIETNPEFAGAQRWRWRHVFVDEFQDLNPAQHRLLAAWLGTRRDLCVVGDPHQAIYGWNGADPGELHHFAERWPDALIVHLDDNHRCSPQIVRAAASVLDGAGTALRSTRPDGPEPDIASFADDDEEATGVAAAVARAVADGTRPTQIAVLARTNVQVQQLATALTAAGVPHRVPGTTDLLTHPVTVRVLAGLRAAPDRPARMAAADLAEEAAGAPAASERDALGALSTLAEQFRDHGEGDAGGLAAWISGALARDRDGAARADGVTVCSFHRAKGLEWTDVWVCGVEEGLVPIGHARTDAAVEEERRLLYVALTRGSDRLHLTWARRRRMGSGGSVPRQPSPWLALVDPAAVPAGPPVERLDADAWRARLAEQRRWLRERDPDGRRGPRPPGRPHPGGPRLALTTPDADVAAALRSWRADAARASGVPAHVLLHARTLEALASLRPTSTEELADVPGLGPVKVARYGPTLVALTGRQAATG